MLVLRSRKSVSEGIAALCLTSLLAIGASAPASAQSSTMNGFKLANDQPINITSTDAHVDDKTKNIIFTGDVVATQGDNKVQAAKMIVKYQGGSTGIASGGGDLERIDLVDNVQVNSKTQQATADTGYFDMVSQQIVLEGKKVVLTEGKNVFVGCKLTVNMVTSEAKLDACGGRVQIQLDPSSQKKN
ncbi:LptA/OstA family protein [Martelella sp. HB161492]|uniref:LptA/OstA family protein n=1 Tax=Martelella sp. HB161492 TaxID=2720726 RepID=UPI0015921E54|nr:LptA/OstA family protein [Martelella sp. HB161492]